MPILKPVTNLIPLETSFGGDMNRLLPKREDIPKEYWNMNSGKQDVFLRWFYRGLPKVTEFVPREDVDPNDALKHIRAIMTSWEPKHEHKNAACSYLLDLWFEKVIFPEE